MVNKNNKILDKWTFVHIVSGLILGRIIKNRFGAYSLIGGFEIVEGLFLDERIFKEVEGFNNVISDLVVSVAAYEVSRMI